MKAIDLLLEDILPPGTQPRVLDKKGMSALASELAGHGGDVYARVMQQVSDLGRNQAYLAGETLGVDDMAPTFDKDALLARMDQALQEARAASKSDVDFEKTRDDIWTKTLGEIDRLTPLSNPHNNVVRSVASGARGNAVQMRAMLSTPGLYTDYRGRIIPIFSRTSHGEGLRPGPYLASSYGVRSSILNTKLATAKGGDYLKTSVQSAVNTSVTEEDCGTANGIDVPVDRDVLGRVLAKAQAGYEAGTPIDREVFRALEKSKADQVIVRSPMTCQSKHGLCSHCLGQLSGGHFAPIGYQAGITAAQGVGEPLVQSSLNSKHSSGVLKGGKKVFSGFDVVSALVQSPEVFPHKAPVASRPGRVESIDVAPQGGNYITVDGAKHYALPGYEPAVKVGDDVEAGDQLSEGVVDVADVVEHRGLGEGRRYYVDRLRQALEESGAGNPSRVNLEVLSRGALDHLRVNEDDGIGDALPDDLISYNTVSAKYQAPVGASLSKPGQSAGKWLHAPALHYTIGTKLTPRMTQRISKAGIDQVVVSDKPPGFSPEMVRLRTASHAGTDWLAKLNTSYLTDNLAHDAERARETNVEHNTNFAPRLAIGKDFGKNVGKKGEF